MSAFADLEMRERRLIAEAAKRMIGEPAYAMAIKAAEADAVEAYLKMPATSSQNLLVEARANVLAIRAVNRRLEEFVLALVGMPKE